MKEGVLREIEDRIISEMLQTSLEIRRLHVKILLKMPNSL